MVNEPLASVLVEDVMPNRDNCFFFYDWFCKDTSLEGKADRLLSRVRVLSKSEKIDPTTMYVWFKNNCPVNGKLYDDIRFSDLETNHVIYTVVPASGHTSSAGRAEVWGRENSFNEPLVVGTWKDVKKFFGV